MEGKKKMTGGGESGDENHPEKHALNARLDNQTLHSSVGATTMTSSYENFYRHHGPLLELCMSCNEWHGMYAVQI